MFTIGRNFHIIHMTGDLEALDEWYDDVFSVWRYMPAGYMEQERRDASLVTVGDLCIEPLAPAFTVDDWDQFPLGRFYRRFGNRWHSLAWFVDEGYVELFRHLRDATVQMRGTAGARQEQDEPVGPIFTHPRDTYTQIEFVPRFTGMRRMPIVDPRSQPAYDPGWWSREHPLQVLKASHATIAVRDVAQARDRYVKLLHAEVIHEGERDLPPTRSAFVTIGDLVVELAQPTAGSVMAQDMEANNESLHSLTFKVRDLSAARTFLESKGVVIAEASADTLVCDPATTHGAPMNFTTWSIPNDDRSDWDARWASQGRASEGRRGRT